MKIPIFSGERIVALCTAEEARRYARVPNAEIVRKRKTGQVMQINLRELADERNTVRSRTGNAQKYTFVEALGGEQATAYCQSLKFIHPDNQSLFQLSVTDCMRAG